MYGIHEDFSPKMARQKPSNRGFGFVFTAVLGLVGVSPLWHHHPARPLLLVTAAGFLLVTLIRPSLLTYPNQAWMSLALLLGKVVNPVITGILFYTVFTPAGILLRALKRDRLGRTVDPRAESYWIARTPSGADSMADQF